MSVAPEINRQRPRYCWDRLEWMCHLSTNQSRALTESCWFPSARVMLDQATRPWLGIQQSLGISWLHAYTGRSFSTWWRWWIREYARKVQSTLAVKLPWSLSILQSWNIQKKDKPLKVNSRLVESIDVQLRLYFSTIAAHAFLFGECSTRMFQHLV